MECSDDCGCDITKCRNRPITSRSSPNQSLISSIDDNQKRLNRDLKETFCWGIDYATHNYISLVLPDYEDIDKDSFIEKKLLPAVHLSVLFILLLYV